MKTNFFFLVSIGVASMSAAQTAVFDFESEPIANYTSGKSFTNNGITVTAMSSLGFIAVSDLAVGTSLGTKSLFATGNPTAAYSPFAPIVFTFDRDIAQATLLSGDGGGPDDDGDIVIKMYDQYDNLVGTQSQYYGLNGNGISFSINQTFRKVVVDTTGTSLPHSVPAEFSSVTASSVPEPATVLELGLISSMLLRRRRSI